MTKPVDSTGAPGAISAAVRRSVAQAQSKTSNNQARAANQSSSSQKGQIVPRPALLASIASRAQSLDPLAPDHAHKVLRLIVETALLNELGNGLINTPKFQSMVDDILQDLKNSPHLKADVDEVIQQISQARS